MLSEAQVFRYGKDWGRVCHSNDWRMDRGRLVPEAVLAESLLHKEVAALGTQHAQQCHRSLTVEDLRKGCVARIVNRFQSVKDFDNAQFDRLLILFRLLVNPDDLAAVMAWEQYKKYDQAKASGCVLPEEPGVRRRLVGSIKQMTRDREAYLYAIVRDKFETIHWEELELRQLRQLAMTLRARTKKWHKPLETKGIEEPF